MQAPASSVQITMHLGNSLLDGSAFGRYLGYQQNYSLTIHAGGIFLPDSPNSLLERGYPEQVQPFPVLQTKMKVLDIDVPYVHACHAVVVLQFFSMLSMPSGLSLERGSSSLAALDLSSRLKLSFKTLFQGRFRDISHSFFACIGKEESGARQRHQECGRGVCCNHRGS